MAWLRSRSTRKEGRYEKQLMLMRQLHHVAHHFIAVCMSMRLTPSFGPPQQSKACAAAHSTGGLCRVLCRPTSAPYA